LQSSPNVSKFAIIKNTTPSRSVPLANIISNTYQQTILDKILEVRQLSNPTEYKQKREELIPYFTPSGEFYRRNDGGLKTHSKILCLDYDNLNPELAKNYLAEIPFIYGLQTSLSQNGIKAFVRLSEQTTPGNHPAVYRHLSNELQDGGFPYAADTGGSPFSQPCFFSYDPDFYLNPDCDSYTIPELIPTPKESAEQAAEHQAVDRLDIPDKIVNEFISVWTSGRWKNSLYFKRLWEGNCEGYRSQSEADWALCRHLAFYLLDDHGVNIPKLSKLLHLSEPGASVGALIEGMFAHSKLANRTKWNRADY